MPATRERCARTALRFAGAESGTLFASVVIDPAGWSAAEAVPGGMAASGDAETIADDAGRFDFSAPWTALLAATSGESAAGEDLSAIPPAEPPALAGASGAAGVSAVTCAEAMNGAALTNACAEIGALEGFAPGVTSEITTTAPATAPVAAAISATRAVRLKLGIGAKQPHAG